MTRSFEYHSRCPYRKHDKDTGPDQCRNCAFHGMDKDRMWVGYCMNCATYKYHLRRGLGFSHGEECNIEECMGIFQEEDINDIKRKIPYNTKNPKYDDYLCIERILNNTYIRATDKFYKK